MKLHGVISFIWPFYNPRHLPAHACSALQLIKAVCVWEIKTLTRTSVCIQICSFAFHPLVPHQTQGRNYCHPQLSFSSASPVMRFICLRVALCVPKELSAVVAAFFSADQKLGLSMQFIVSDCCHCSTVELTVSGKSVILGSQKNNHTKNQKQFW